MVTGGRGTTTCTTPGGTAGGACVRLPGGGEGDAFLRRELRETCADFGRLTVVKVDRLFQGIGGAVVEVGRRFGEAPHADPLAPALRTRHRPGRARLDEQLRDALAEPQQRGAQSVVERVRRVFDVGADPLQIATHLRNDPRLRRAVARRPGLRVPGVVIRDPGCVSTTWPEYFSVLEHL